jgi:hypothetical protein
VLEIQISFAIVPFRPAALGLPVLAVRLEGDALERQEGGDVLGRNRDRPVFCSPRRSQPWEANSSEVPGKQNESTDAAVRYGNPNAESLWRTMKKN